ncbi:MAG: OmpA family protein [Bacteroidales bacterium]|nr:OmpA family protein [Bacteroidales bacterium]MBR3540832.1 OmpA family protein [Bacteroidales bacterium]
MKKLFLVALALSSALCVSAQKLIVQDYQSSPYWYGGIKGGIQWVPTNYDFGSLIAPAFGVQLGRQMTPVVGIRGDFQGLWSKTAFKSADETMNFKYYTIDADLTFNIVNLFLEDTEHLLDFSLLAGAGFNYSWDAEDAAKYPIQDRMIDSHSSLKSYNMRLGAIVGANISRNWIVELEFDANNLKDRFNSKSNTHRDWQLTTMLGLKYCWGHPSSSRDVDRSELISDTKYCDVCGLSLARCPWNGNHPGTNAQPEPLPAVVYNSAEEVHIEVFFDLDNAEIRPSEDAKLRGLSNFIRDHEIGTVLVKGYADRETGNPNYNQRLSERRAQTIVDVLTGSYGVPASRIESRAYGDKVQPFQENDLNRVVIIDIKEAEKK